MHKLACYIAAYSIDHGWIDERYQDYCWYAIERRLEFCLFMFVQCILSILLGKPVEAFIFVAVSLMFRQRMGGIHANAPWVCQLLSQSCVVFVVLVLGPLFERVTEPLRYVVDVLAIFMMAIIKPSVPPQVHFSQSEIVSNTRRKNFLLVCLVVLQLLSLKRIEGTFVLYSSLGLLFVIISVLLEKTKYFVKEFINDESIR